MTDLLEGLDASVPLALLPVRLQARIKDNTLKVRILPDAIHANAHTVALTNFEAAAGKAYWHALWASSGEDPVETTVQRDRLGALVGPYRAVHVANVAKPKNWGEFDDEPIFEEIELIDSAPPVQADLLPDFWMYRLFDRSMRAVLSGRCDNDVAIGLAMAPTLGGIPQDEKIENERTDDDHVTAFLKSQNLRWMVDFDAAYRAGMAFSVDISNIDERFFGAILVAGVRQQGDTIETADTLDELFQAHWYSTGLDILPQGTATNNTDLGHTNQTDALPDMDALFMQDAKRRPISAASRAALLDGDPANLLRLPAADTTSLSFGMTFANILDRTAHGEEPEALAGATFNACIGTGLGQYFFQSPPDRSGGAFTFGGWLARDRRPSRKLGACSRSHSQSARGCSTIWNPAGAD